MVFFHFAAPSPQPGNRKHRENQMSMGLRKTAKAAAASVMRRLFDEKHLFWRQRAVAVGGDIEISSARQDKAAHDELSIVATVAGQAKRRPLGIDGAGWVNGARAGDANCTIIRTSLIKQHSEERAA